MSINEYSEFVVKYNREFTDIKNDINTYIVYYSMYDIGLTLDKNVDYYLDISEFDLENETLKVTHKDLTIEKNINELSLFVVERSNIKDPKLMSRIKKFRLEFWKYIENDVNEKSDSVFKGIMNLRNDEKISVKEDKIVDESGYLIMKFNDFDNENYILDSLKTLLMMN